MSKLLQPFNEDTSRGKIPQCEICHKKFHKINRAEHKCKRCYRSVCVNCAPERATTYKQDGTIKDHRVCKKCQAESRLILKYFQDYKLKFGTDSEFSTIWVKRLNKQKKPYSVIMAQYSQNLSETNQSIQKFKRQSSIIFQDLYKSYNYSIRHFFQLTKSNISNKQVQESVTNVMVSVFSKIGSLSYFPQMIYLAVFFLNFSSQCQAYMILTGLFEKVYPQYQTIFRPKRDNLLGKQIKLIVSMIQRLIEPSQKNIMPQVKQYLDSQANKMLNTLTINFCNFQVTLHLIHETLQKVSYLQLYKGIASLVYLAKDIIIQRLPYEQVERFILKSITLENVKAQMCRLQKVQVQSNPRTVSLSNSTSNFNPANSQTRTESQISSMLQSNPMNQKILTLQKMITLIQTQLQKKIQQLIFYKAKCIQYQKQLQAQSRQKTNLKQQLCFLGCRLEQIHKYQQMKSKHDQSLQKSRQLQISNIKLKNQINLLLAKNHQHENQISQYKMIYEIDENYLTKLQTQNEILKLKLQVKEINIQTDHFQQQILNKNRKILQFEQNLQQSKIKIKYLQKSIKQMQQQLIQKIQIITNNIKQDTKTQSSSNDNNDQLKQYKQQNQLCLKTLKKQKQRIDELQIINKTNINRISQLQSQIQTINKQKKILNQKLDQMIKLQIVPKQQDKSLIQLIDKEIQKEDNLMRKNDLQKIKNKTKYYQHQLKIKDLDLRLKSNKIQEYLNLKRAEEEEKQKIDTLVNGILERQANGLGPENQQKQECLLF